MPEPELYKHYDRSEAIAFFGSGGDAEILCDGQWMIWSSVALCLTDIGDPPRKSHFDRGSSFWWVADKPYSVGGQRYTSFLPSEVVGSAGRERSIKLFVRPAGSKNYQYLGTLGPSYHQRMAEKNSFGQANFDLSPSMPSRLWIELGGLRAGDMNHASVDAALDRLRGQTTTQDRFEVLQRLVEYWHGPIGPGDGFSEDELANVQIPQPLRRWYRWAGRRSEIMNGWNIFLKPTAGRDQLRLDGDKLVYCTRSNYQWATLPQGVDPPVFIRYGPLETWQSEPQTLSEHLILVCLSEGVLRHCGYGASAARLPERRVKEITTSIPQVRLNPLRCPGYQMKPQPGEFFVHNGVFVFAVNCGTPHKRVTYSVWVGARTEEPLRFLKPHVDHFWGDVSL